MVIFITAVFTLFSLFRTPSFQVLAGRLTAGYLSKHLHTQIYLDKVRITDLLFLQFKGLQVNDHHDRKLLRIEDLSVKIQELLLNDQYIGFERVSIDSGEFYLEKYPEDSLLNLAIFLQGFQHDSIVIEDTLPSPAWTFKCHELIIDKFTFGLRNDTVATAYPGIDFDDMLLSGIYVEMKEINVIGDSIAAFIEHISSLEKSGFELLNFSGDARVSATGIRLKGGQVSTGRSSIDLDLDFLYDGYDQLSWFLDSVTIRSKIRSSLLTPGDIGYFAPELLHMEDPVMFSGMVEGAVSDFVARDLKINFGEFSEFEGEFGMKGLPYIDSTFFSLNLDHLTTVPEDISGFDLPLENSTLDLPPQVLQMGFTTISGRFEGYLSDFTTSLNVSSDAGNIVIDGSLSENAETGQMIFSASLAGNAVHLGNLLQSEELGTLDFELEAEGSGSTLDDLDLAVDGWIQDMEVKKYMYEKIILGGKIKGKSFDGRIMVDDKSLVLKFDGLVDFNHTVPEYDFLLELEKARLNDIHLSDRSKDQNLKGTFKIDFKGSNADSFYGQLLLNDLIYTEESKDYTLHHLELNRRRNAGQPDVTALRSDYIDGDVTGRFIIKDLITQFSSFILGNEEDTAIWNHMSTNPQYVSFDFRLKNIAPVTELLMPGITISPGATLVGLFDSQNHKLELYGHTDEISISGIHISEVDMSGTTTGQTFDFNIDVRQIMLQDNEDGSDVSLDNLSARLVTGDSSLNYKINWDNKAEIAPNRGTLDGFIHYNSMNSIEAGLNHAEANIYGNDWRIDPDNFIVMDSSNLSIRNFKIYKGEESLVVDGKLSDQPHDTLNLYFDDWSLDNFNPFMSAYSLELEGVINGRFGIFRHNQIINLFAGIHIDDLNLNQVYFGDADLKTRWLEGEQALAADLGIFSKGTSETPFKILGVSGLYYPFDDKRNFDFDIATQNLNISVLEPLLSSFSSHLAGYATGKLSLEGTNVKPVILGKLKLQRAEMMVDYLNVIYSFSNEIVFKEDMIRFNELKVYDPNSNTAILNGGIKHHYFNNMSLDLAIEPVNFMALNLDRYQNEVFYGTAYATGKVNLTGPFENLTIQVDVVTDKNTKISIPINYSVDVSENNFIVFTHDGDTAKTDKKEEVQIVGLNLDIAAQITSDADIEIFLPGNIGNLRAKGNGKLRMGVDPYGYLTLNGSYVIHAGLFVFSLEQLVSRRFDILEGSKISWTGDINDAEVSIVARYRLRTDLSGLGITLIESDAASQKVIVFTDIRMTGNLFNPELNFGITFPNLQEQTRQAVYAVLDTNDKGLMNQQAISLLVLGSFSSTGTGGTNPVNPAAIVSNTLSNMLSQISNDFNIGINYMPGDQVSSEQLEVALSTQLLDDRLIIDGNIDVSGSDASSQKTSSIVGDINVEYKLTPDGRFRVKAFNRSNDLSLFNDYAPYTQGVGVFYRKDFNNLGELFRKENAKARKKKEKD